MKKQTKLETNLAEEAREILTNLKASYQRLDEITETLIKSKKSEFFGVALVDNFQGKNLAWKSTPCRRFELKLTIPSHNPTKIRTVTGTSLRPKTRSKQDFFPVRRNKG